MATQTTRSLARGKSIVSRLSLTVFHFFYSPPVFPGVIREREASLLDSAARSKLEKSEFFLRSVLCSRFERVFVRMIRCTN
jgi:hypothetical protein